MKGRIVATEKELLKKFLDPLRACKRYKPKFGQGNKEEGVSLPQFLDLYGADPFYAWCGLNSGLMYAAHKAAGGMTSVYRQIGKGCENLFREIIIDATGYTDRASAAWSYKTKTGAGKDKTLSLDGRLKLEDIQNAETKRRVEKWLADYCKLLGAEVPQHGAVFEVRQGYKSKDSKRQNGDIDNIAVAWAQGYMPVFAIFSSQIDGDLVLRYRNSRGGIVVGRTAGASTESLFAFSRDVLGFDLADFFRRNSPAIKKEMTETLEALLSA
ncbi:hypothetical protein [Bordetella hinzii]|uniref:Uncharacterized protein n=1 Tax=Bordetella hinzii TaxID=103855 RepID=A0AAN1VHV2_9BORD|nr:hypothetical protein [Bordetella hinzii]AKQ54699.1 hypothetical protein ACR54_01363 [Bordetella hinzii]AKQ59212.1 hypothetical protein ACR55_01324 [Bordetella hinzii]AZW19394.1 hypothetical protein CS347_01395 [Bordetella hinzii]KXA70684.1 hypothetical protein AXA74_22480 [Bordetella hinzii LMG 13501]MBZ0076765.1 hypothetical protein [Bordetella hinzii]